MKKSLILILSLLQYFCNIEAQSCLPGGFIFGYQTQIDAFQALYPGCTVIEGDVEIVGEDISNLEGLSVLIAINGDLHLRNLDGVFNFSGLDSLSYIGGDLIINYNDSILNLEGLNGLSYVGGDVLIALNDSLINFSGLNSLDSIGGRLRIQGHYNLVDLSGLDELKKINGQLLMTSNHELKNIQNLINLAYVGGDLYIVGNAELISLEGLNNLTTFSEMTIAGNSDLTNLEGLENLNTVNGNVELNANTEMIDLTGLEGLTSISGSLYIHNNWSLVDLTGLENLTSINGTLFIHENHDLLSLSGIGNIDAGGIADLAISSNTELTDCDVMSICEYLAAPNGVINIDDNATGCNSQQEVETDCGVSLDEKSMAKNHIMIYPNPSSFAVTIERIEPKNKCLLIILDVNGNEVIKRQNSESITVLDISHLPDGVYFARLTCESDVKMFKIIKY